MVKKKCLCWEIRNDSKNVASALQPDLQKSVKTKCYCADEICAPTLFQKPKGCICEQDQDDNLQLKRKSSSNLKKLECKAGMSNLVIPKNSKTQEFVEKVTYESLFGPKDKKVEDYVSKHLPRMPDSDDPFYSGLVSQRRDSEKICNITNYERRPSSSKFASTESKSYASQRLSVPKVKSYSGYFSSSENINRKSSKDEIMNYLQSMDSPKSENSDLDQTPKNFSQSMHYNTEIEEPKFFKSQLFESKDSISKIENFRKEHYFETHSTEDLLTKLVTDHVCVHSFSLDDRQFPQPLYGNAFGMSQCVICGKTMKQPLLIKDKEEKKSEIFPKFYRYGLAPKKIHLAGDSNVKIEMTLESKDNFRAIHCKKPEFFPNFALRYQKGVAY